MATASSSAVELDHRRHRPEDLLVEDGGVRGDSRQDGRLVEETFAVGHRRPHRDAGAGVDGLLDHPRDVVARALVDHGTDLIAPVDPGSELHGPHGAGQHGCELLCDRRVDQESVGGRAGLAGIAHLGHHGTFERRVQIGVLEHDEGRVAAELHRHIEHLVCGHLEQRLADLGRSGERQLAHPRVVQAFARSHPTSPEPRPHSPRLEVAPPPP